MIACGRYEECYDVFQYLIKTSHQTLESRKKLSVRLGDMLMKIWTLVGIPVTIMALGSIVKAEKEAGLPIPSLDEQFQSSIYSTSQLSPKDVETRGFAAMKLRYRADLERIMGSWGVHQADVEWLQKRVIYGLFLSNNDVLNEIETQCLSTAAIMCQGLERPTMWHIRGLLRLGVSVEAAEKMCDIVKLVAKKMDGRTDANKWMRAADVEH
jgi:hypothetical protein